MVTGSALAPETGIRALARHDLAAVVEIDARETGRSRRDYFERRLQAALREPRLHLQFAVERNGRLAGFAMARRLEGEFGRSEPALRLEVIGVDREARAGGHGTALLAALEAQARLQGMDELRTQAHWKNHGMLRFLDRSGFELDRNHVIDCAVHAGPVAGPGEDEVLAPPHARGGTEIDYGAPRSNDFEALARDRADVRSLRPADVADLARIDRRVTGRDRSAYIARQIEEALLDSAVRVSLASHCDGAATGYLAAKVDFGDFGRTEPTAVIDTLSVDPERAGTGIGTALVSQLFVNLQALQVERVETVVARERLDLLGFFYRLGFTPGARLGFVKRLSQGAAGASRA
ncbi:MAG: GNAT family N-acetyltransferase [Burkholderiales bacterium]|nr:GNAT family N-acetyltransferase [Burkholderiales bacterium]